VVIFDKTGTLTSAAQRLVAAEHIDSASLSLAATLAAHSRHPYSQALVEAAAGLAPSPVVFDDITEQAGFGLQAQSGATVYRLGKPSWALAGPESIVGTASVILTRNGQLLTGFRFEDTLRTDAAVAVAQLKQDGFRVEIVSGDREEPVGLVAAALGVPYRSGVTPSEKVARIKSLSAAGQKVVMVGDGLNDTPALGAAHASMAPASASDVGRCAADFVFLRQSLLAIPLAVSVAREARRLIRQNLALAVAYNIVAVPIAIMGLVTPLIAAVAMSASSILVVANALRLKRREGIAASAAPAAITAAAILEAAE
jgi:Cu2+-exporting ATPase